MSARILCAIDISDKHDDTPVLIEALRQADMNNGELDIITVVPNLGVTLVGDHFSKNFQAEAVEEARKRLQTLTDDVLGVERNKSVRNIVATGSVYEEILELADKTNPALIVIGAHRENLKDFLLGPNAARVVRHSKCSVFVVRLND